MTPAERQLIKHAQNELVKACGGIDSAKLLCSYGRSTIGRWADVGDPSLMPLSVIRTNQYKAASALPQKSCGLPVVTAALAALDNRTLSDPVETSGTSQNVLTAIAETFVAVGALNISYGEALADGKVTLNELSDLDRRLAHLVQSAMSARKATAAGRADGGLSIIGGGQRQAGG